MWKHPNPSSRLLDHVITSASSSLTPLLPRLPLLPLRLRIFSKLWCLILVWVMECLRLLLWTTVRWAARCPSSLPPRCLVCVSSHAVRSSSLPPRCLVCVPRMLWDPPLSSPPMSRLCSSHAVRSSSSQEDVCIICWHEITHSCFRSYCERLIGALYFKEIVFHMLYIFDLHWKEFVASSKCDI